MTAKWEFCDARHIWSRRIPFQFVVVVSSGGSINEAPFSRFDTLNSGFKYNSGMDTAAHGHCCVRYGLYGVDCDRRCGASAHETNIGCPKKFGRDQVDSL